MHTQSDKSSRRGRLSRPLTMVTIIGLAATVAVGIGVSSASAAGSLTKANVYASNNQKGATDVTYTATFTTATPAIIGSFSVDLPVSVSSRVSPGTIYGLGGGKYSLSGSTAMYKLDAPALVAADTPLYIEFTGMTNVDNSINGFFPQMRTFNIDDPDTNNDESLTIIDSGQSAEQIDISPKGTEAQVQVPKSLTFTNDNPGYTLLMDPSIPSLRQMKKTINLTVKTNVGLGYTLVAKNTGLKAKDKSGATDYTFPSVVDAKGLAESDLPDTIYGFSATLTSPGGMSLAALPTGGPLAAGNVMSLTSTAAPLVNATKPTGATADTITLTNRVKMDFNIPAGTYEDTITFTVTANY